MNKNSLRSRNLLRILEKHQHYKVILRKFIQVLSIEKISKSIIYNYSCHVETKKGKNPEIKKNQNQK